MAVTPCTVSGSLLRSAELSADKLSRFLWEMCFKALLVLHSKPTMIPAELWHVIISLLWQSRASQDKVNVFRTFYSSLNHLYIQSQFKSLEIRKWDETRRPLMGPCSDSSRCCGFKCLNVSRLLSETFINNNVVFLLLSVTTRWLESTVQRQYLCPVRKHKVVIVMKLHGGE